MSSEAGCLVTACPGGGCPCRNVPDTSTGARGRQSASDLEVSRTSMAPELGPNLPAEVEAALYTSGRACGQSNWPT